nr:PDZ domain-containing protein [Luteolibacter marinus]
MEVVVDEHQRNEGQGYVGITMTRVAIMIPGEKGVTSGVRISGVEPDSPATKAGLSVGDVIVGIDKRRWEAAQDSVESFIAEVRETKPGKELDLEILRAGELMRIAVTLGTRRMGMPESKLRFNFGNGEFESVDLDQLEKEAKEEFFKHWLAEKQAIDGK